MRKILTIDFIERLLFTAIVAGIFIGGFAVVRYVDIVRRLSTNEAAQIHASGGEVTVETKGQAQGLMAADIERRRLLADQSSMMMVGGVGLALIGLGWLAGDILRGRRRKASAAQSGSVSVPT